MQINKVLVYTVFALFKGNTLNKLALALLLSFIFTAPAFAQPFAYVANGAAVDVVDTTTNMVTTSIPVFPIARDIALTPDGTRAYVATSGFDIVQFIDTATNMVDAMFINVGNFPNGLAMSPDGTTLYVINFFGNDVTVVDTATNMVVTSIPVGINPRNGAITPDGTRLYVTDSTSDTISVINTATNMVIATIPNGVDTQPIDIAITPDGTRAYVANDDTSTVTVIDTATNMLIGMPIPIGMNATGARCVIITPDGSRVYVCDGDIDDIVAVIDTTTNTVIANIPVGNGPNGGGITPDGSTLYIADQDSNTISVINTATNTVVGMPIPVGFTPLDVDLIPPLPPGSLTITKSTVPGGLGGFDFLGTGFANNCGLDGMFILDDDTFPMGTSFITCPTLPPASYMVQELPEPGFVLTDIDCVGASSFSETPDSVTVDIMTGETVVCTFTNTQLFTLTLNKIGTGDGTVTSDMGTINCAPACTSDSDEYFPGTMVTLTAGADATSTFNGWGGDCLSFGMAADATVTMDQARTCTADFVLMTRNLTLNKTGNGDGTVTSMLPGIDCAPGCTTDNSDFDINTMVTLTAAPDGDSLFTGWAGDCASAMTNPMAAVTMDQARTCEANFILQSFTVDVTVNGTGNGSVTAMPPTIECGVIGMDCDETYLIHTQVTLTAAPEPDSLFTGWSGDADCSDGIIQDLTANTSCIATFANNLFVFDVIKEGPGDGLITSEPTGIDCGVDCSEIYLGDTLVTLTVEPDLISSFVGWSGDCSGTNLQTSITVLSDSTCIATFEFREVVLNPIFPALDDNINSISAEVATPGGNVAFIWGKQTGSFTIGGRVCGGTELGIKNPNLLTIKRANDFGIATHIFYIPTFNDLQFEVQLQAIDIETCRTSNIVPQIIRKDESG